MIGTIAIALVGVAFHTALACCTSDLPDDAFSAVPLGRLGLTGG